jgi:hypothetical protein
VYLDRKTVLMTRSATGFAQNTSMTVTAHHEATPPIDSGTASGSARSADAAARSAAAMLAWVGFGANGISSALYGSEKSYVALGAHAELVPLLALATTITVFVIATAYSQVMISPSGSWQHSLTDPIPLSA